MNDLLNFGTENPYREFNDLINGYFLKAFRLETTADYFNHSLGEDGGYYMRCYIRDLVMGTLVYWLTAGIWAFFEYCVFRKHNFTKKQRVLPTYEIMIDQICLAQSSLLVYAALPVLSEFLIESKITHVYFYISDVGGWGYYALYFLLYLTFVEVGIYWMHRTLHTNKFLYKYIHGLHHKYNSAQTLTPWASIAFNPLDGILQVKRLFFCSDVFHFSLFVFPFLLLQGMSLCDRSVFHSRALFNSCFHVVFLRYLGNEYP
jgi:sterol desaturase/sphingolipid hydroxylase (fatty acid hydroxylase superfamily)